MNVLCYISRSGIDEPETSGFCKKQSNLTVTQEQVLSVIGPNAELGKATKIERQWVHIWLRNTLLLDDDKKVCLKYSVSESPSKYIVVSLKGAFWFSTHLRYDELDQSVQIVMWNPSRLSRSQYTAYGKYLSNSWIYEKQEIVTQNYVMLQRASREDTEYLFWVQMETVSEPRNSIPVLMSSLLNP